MVKEGRRENAGLVDVLYFLQSPSKLFATVSLNEYISRNTGVFQTFLCKRIVSEVYRGLITKELAILIFERIQWNEISDILIRSFVCLSSHTKNVVLDSLSLVFKRYFDILNLHAMN